MSSANYVDNSDKLSLLRKGLTFGGKEQEQERAGEMKGQGVDSASALIFTHHGCLGHGPLLLTLLR